MFGVIILYSSDRLRQFNQMLDCLKDMEGIDQCKIVVCIDGKNNIDSDFVSTIEIKRTSKFYCWADCIQAGLDFVENEKILYLDSDRILPSDYLKKISPLVDDKSFVFPKNLMQFNCDVELSTIKHIRDNPGSMAHLYRNDPRIYSDPVSAIRKKNPMSGCVAFTKKCYVDSGGFDSSFQGWGYPDTDYFMSTYKQGHNFIPVDCVELHLSHNHINPYEENVVKSRTMVRLMGLWNGVKFCRKWEIPIHKEIIGASAELEINIEDVENKTLECFIKQFSGKRFLI